MQNDENSMAGVWKKYGIYLDQKGKNPDYFPGKYGFSNQYAMVSSQK